MSNTMDTITFVAIGTNIIIAIPMILWLCTFYRLRHIQEISTRLPKTSILAGILCIFGVSITHPVVLLNYNISFIQTFPHSITMVFILIMISDIGPYHIFTFRAFLIYFDIKWNKAIEDQKWRLFIDPKETNWFLKNRNLWGNQKRIAMLLFMHWLFWLVIGIILTSLSHINHSLYGRVILILVTLIPTSIDCMLYCKFPKFNDVFHISDEIKLTLKAEIVEILIFYIVAIALNAQPPSYQYMGLQCLPVVINFIFTLIIFRWVFKKFGLPSMPCSVAKYMQVVNLNHELSSRKSTLSNTKHKSEHGSHGSVFRILQSKHGFNAFARHLTKEFCIENLLFIVETQQWLQSLSKKAKYMQFANGDLDKNGVFSLAFEFPETAPKSRIIQQSEASAKETHVNTDEIVDDLPSVSEYLQCCQLFDKYIKNSAYFMINISSETRLRMYQTLGCNDLYSSTSQSENKMAERLRSNKLSKEDLFYLYGDCRQEIFTLLTYAFARFKRSDEYIQLNQKLH